MQTGAATVENSMAFPQKTKMELPFELAIPLLGLYLKNPETPIQKNLCTPMFIAAQFTIAKCWKQPNCPPVNEWIKKLWYLYTMGKGLGQTLLQGGHTEGPETYEKMLIITSPQKDAN